MAPLTLKKKIGTTTYYYDRYILHVHEGTTIFFSYGIVLKFRNNLDSNRINISAVFYRTVKGGPNHMGALCIRYTDVSNFYLPLNALQTIMQETST